mgnify:CR=1 FL=1
MAMSPGPSVETDDQILDWVQGDWVNGDRELYVVAGMQQLLDDGVITDDEYRAFRERVLQ